MWVVARLPQRVESTFFWKLNSKNKNHWFPEFEQDLTDFMVELPRLPEDLPLRLIEQLSKMELFSDFRALWGAASGFWKCVTSWHIWLTMWKTSIEIQYNFRILLLAMFSPARKEFESMKSKKSWQWPEEFFFIKCYVICTYIPSTQPPNNVHAIGLVFGKGRCSLMCTLTPWRAWIDLARQARPLAFSKVIQRRLVARPKKAFFYIYIYTYCSSNSSSSVVILGLTVTQ